jgi:hypothetical protein
MTFFSEWFVVGLLRSSLGLSAAALLVALVVRGLRLRSPRGEQIAWLLVLLQGVLLAPAVLPIPRDWMPAVGQVAADEPVWALPPQVEPYAPSPAVERGRAEHPVDTEPATAEPTVIERPVTALARARAVQSRFQLSWADIALAA